MVDVVCINLQEACINLVGAMLSCKLTFVFAMPKINWAAGNKLSIFCVELTDIKAF